MIQSEFFSLIRQLVRESLLVESESLFEFSAVGAVGGGGIASAGSGAIQGHVGGAFQAPAIHPGGKKKKRKKSSRRRSQI